MITKIKCTIDQMNIFQSLIQALSSESFYSVIPFCLQDLMIVIKIDNQQYKHA